MSHCFADAFRLACDHDHLELYGDVLLDEDEEVSIPEFSSLAKYYETQNSPTLAGKYYFHAKNYQKVHRKIKYLKNFMTHQFHSTFRHLIIFLKAVNLIQKMMKFCHWLLK